MRRALLMEQAMRKKKKTFEGVVLAVAFSLGSNAWCFQPLNDVLKG